MIIFLSVYISPLFCHFLSHIKFSYIQEIYRKSGWKFYLCTFTKNLEEPYIFMKIHIGLKIILLENLYLGTRSQREPVPYITCTRLRVLQGVSACYNHIIFRQGRYLAAGLAPGVKTFWWTNWSYSSLHVKKFQFTVHNKLELVLDWLTLFQFNYPIFF